MEKYMHGLHQEVFPVILPDVFHKEGLTFEQVRKWNTQLGQDDQQMQIMPLVIFLIIFSGARIQVLILCAH